jgi:RES domain-containing protein
MEYFVHIDPILLPRELLLVAIQIPDDIICTVDFAALPTSWRSYPPPDAVKDVGTAWLRKRASAALRVPSAIIPEEHNVVLNVDHIDFGRIEFGPPSKFIFGVRT